MNRQCCHECRCQVEALTGSGVMSVTNSYVYDTRPDSYYYDIQRIVVAITFHRRYMNTSYLENLIGRDEVITNQSLTLTLLLQLNGAHPLLLVTKSEIMYPLAASSYIHILHYIFLHISII